MVVGAAFLVSAVSIALLMQLHSRLNSNKTSDNPTVQKIAANIPSLESAVKKNPNDPIARYNLGVAYYATSNPKKAIDEYRRAISLDPHNALYHNNLGNAYRDTRQYADAKAEYQKAITANDKDKTAYINLANLQLYYLNDTQGALATYDKAITRIDKPHDIMLLKGLAHEKAGNKDKAIEVYRQILQQDSNYAPARNNLDRLNAR
jgi:tetratricopeptide (TPR) repeat protein